MNSEQLARLPRYARNEIDRLSSDLDLCKKQLSEMGAEKSNTRIRTYEEKDVYLPNGSSIVFDSDGGSIEVSVVRYGGHATHSYTVIEACTSTIGRSIQIVGGSSNLVELGTVER